jgi:hypothetical protein
MARRVRVTKTLNPLHFEDLEPHRFEDLIRRLLYGFKDWSTIESTGRGGSDEGFDVRAWERSGEVTNASDEGEEGIRALDGNLWQIQGKREKTIAPARMRLLIREGVNAVDPPYGYILAAATNISMSTYDVFRRELRRKGVVEFHFWGKDYLEDQLSLPQNDEILFTFFGLSLSPRRRTRVAEVKFAINNKNRLLKLLYAREEAIEQGIVSGKSFLLRDIKDEVYPYKTEYRDFDDHPRWEKHEAARVTARGVYFRFRQVYACVDKRQKSYDFFKAVDLAHRTGDAEESIEARLEETPQLAERFWRHLPRRTQAKLFVEGFVSFADMLIVDERGDPAYSDPHIFVDFGPKGPFTHFFEYFVSSGEVLSDNDLDGIRKVDLFPAVFPRPVKGQIHDSSALNLPGQARWQLEHQRGALTIYSFKGELGTLQENDFVRVPAKEPHGVDKFVEITHVEDTSVGDVLRWGDENYLRSQLQMSAERELTDESERVRIYELHSVWDPAHGDFSTYFE